MLAAERLLQIREEFGEHIETIVPLDFEDNTLRVILYLRDGTNLRVTEQWRDQTLLRYSYYWLTTDNALKIGWDNATHHRDLNGFPHHQHIGEQTNVEPSPIRCLEDVMRVILTQRSI